MNGLQRLAVAVAGVIALVALLAPIVITGRVEAVNEQSCESQCGVYGITTPRVEAWNNQGDASVQEIRILGTGFGVSSLAVHSPGQYLEHLTYAFVRGTSGVSYATSAYTPHGTINSSDPYRRSSLDFSGNESMVSHEKDIKNKGFSAVLPTLTEAQEAWIDRLQRCESGTDPTQVNEVDRDGTPSYYAFQFKPSTFRGLGVAYRVIPKGLTTEELMEALKRTDLQRAIVAHMIGDKDIRWGQQFPDCVRKHIGMPPGAAGRLE